MARWSAGLVVLAVARLIPLTGVQFYVQSVALLVALWPLAYEMWRRPKAAAHRVAVRAS